MTATVDVKKDPVKSEEASARPSDTKPTGNASLAPPSKPGQNSSDPDYFSGAHGGSHFSLEPNPFEQSFGNPSTDTPGKFGGLPSVASLTSPQALGPSGTPGWGGSLRSGPLSPAMLAGPTGNTGYFDDSFRGSFPTPNESSLRSGLTPGAGGSIFPAPSPNSQAIFNSLQSGGATPGTLEFQRTAMTAAARTKLETSKSATSTNAASSSATSGNANSNTSNNTSSAPNTSTNNKTAMPPNKSDYQPAQGQQGRGQDSYVANHSESDAVNSLYLLAQTGNRNANQFAVPNQPGVAQMSRADNQDQSSSNSKKGANAKNSASNVGRRKADETPTKGSAKRSKGNNGHALSPEDEDDDEDMDSDMDIKNEDGTSSGRKMTDEEKRKNFLERNRIAALKCRQRKKQWLANLQTKVEIFQSENDALTAQCTTLREEIVNLKSLLLAHKDCPVSHSQGLGGSAMAQVIGDFNPHANPYGIPLGGGNQMMGMQSQGMQRG